MRRIYIYKDKEKKILQFEFFRVKLECINKKHET